MFLDIVIPHYTEGDYQERAAVTAGQGQGASSTETAGNLHHLVYYETSLILGLLREGESKAWGLLCRCV